MKLCVLSILCYNLISGLEKPTEIRHIFSTLCGSGIHTVVTKSEFNSLTALYINCIVGSFNSQNV